MRERTFKVKVEYVDFVTVLIPDDVDDVEQYIDDEVYDRINVLPQDLDGMTIDDYTYSAMN